MDPNHELNILLTATIQADLRSDNFLTVCTALQAIPTIANAELANVFLPEVIKLVKHDRDQVKKKALITLHSLLRVDPSIGIEIGKVFVDRLGYKEPAVMFAVLPGLYELINENPEPYKGLVHYFTDILKQASEGKLGRNWVVHKAPAPFLQVTLLRLLGCLGKGDSQVSSDMEAVLIDVWKRAQSLMNQAGNAILFECMKTATSIMPSDALYSISLDTAAVFLNSTDNNLKCAGIEILGRIIEDGDSGKVQQHQMAIVAALRSSDVTLKGRTLDLLFRMTGSNNIEVVFEEVLDYIVEDSVDEESRKFAALKLLEVSEKFAPSLLWFVDSITKLLKKAGSSPPPLAQNTLIKVLQENENPGNLSGGDVGLHSRITHTYFETISGSKVPVPLAKVICWALGEYGMQSGLSFESLCFLLLEVLESHTNSPELAVVCILALSKLNARHSQDLPAEVISLLRSLRSSKNLEIQQNAFEVLSIASMPPEARRAVMFKKQTNTSLSYLDSIASIAADSGSAPYISKEDRSFIDYDIDKNAVSDSLIRFEAYDQQQEVPEQKTALPSDMMFGDLSQREDIPKDIDSTSEMQKIHVKRDEGSRRWGPLSERKLPDYVGHSQPNQVNKTNASRLEPSVEPQAHQSTGYAIQSKIDPQQEMLAASLFTAPVTRTSRSSETGPSASKSTQPITFDLLDLATESIEPSNAPSDIFDLLGSESSTSQPAAVVETENSHSQQRGDCNTPGTRQQDPFEGLL